MAKPRSLSKSGLSIVDANQGRLVTYQQDVLDIKSRIENELWPGLVSVFFDDDPSAECWVIVEHCKDGTDAIMFTEKRLSQATIDRIQRADQTLHPDYDPLAEIEKEEEKLEKEKDRRFSERIGDTGERLFYALRRDGLIHAPRVYLSNSARRARGVT